MSAALLEGSYEDSVYGAVSFREANPTAGAFDYTLHVRVGKYAVVVTLSLKSMAVIRLVCRAQSGSISNQK